MTTFAHTEKGYVDGPEINATAAEYLARFRSDITTGWTVTQVPDGTKHGARPDGSGGWLNPVPVVLTPTPNNANNPYWPKKILETKDFFALLGQVLGTNYARLRNDTAFLWVLDVLDHIELVNTDDKAGQFLAILVYLTNTNAQDGQKLMSTQTVSTVMAAWPAA